VSEGEERELRRRARQQTRAYREVLRAKIVLLAAAGLENAEIARRLDTTREAVSCWRKRFHGERLQGLEDRPRAGRPRRFPPRGGGGGEGDRLPVAERARGPAFPLSSAEIAREAVAGGIVERVSGATVWRWLAEDAIRPWNYRSWIFPRDPDFRAKATRVLDLYAGRWEGKLLHPGEFVLCADEKPSIQARARLHPTTAPLPGGDGQLVEHEDERMGALCYLAAWDVRRAKLFDRCQRQGGIEPFDRLVAQAMSQEPYATAPARLLGRQRLLASRSAVDRAAQEPLPEPRPRPPANPCQLAQSNRDLLLDRPAQAPSAQRLHRPRRRRKAASQLRTTPRASRPTVRAEVHTR